MRDFSKVSPSVWRSKKFKKLSGEGEKLVYLYLLTCPHGNSAGCFDLDPSYVCADMGITEKAYRKAMDSLSSVGLVLFDETENTVFITNWATFNPPTNVKHAMGLVAQIDGASSCALKAAALRDFKATIEAKGFDSMEALSKTIDRLSIAYAKPIDTLSHQTRPERDQTKTERERENKAPEEEISLVSLMDDWNSMASKSGLSKVERLTDQRRKALKARIEEAGSIEAFKTTMAKIAKSRFLTGQNDRKWKADFDFILQPTSFVKLSEGKYDDQPNGQHHPPTVPETSWEERLWFARKNKTWDSKKWGPYPNQPGCLAPAALLLPEDGKGWTNWGEG
jgi:hypothetical protein